MSSHTPGPWTAFLDRDPPCIGKDEDDLVIAEMVIYSTGDPDLPDEIQDANARLIAAAPDLLDACRYAARACTFCEGQGVTSSQLGPMDCPQCDPIRKAIDKAEGRNPQS